MSLARLLTKQGRRNEARTMLSEIYNWFTEGFDTLDLKEAKALIDETQLRILTQLAERFFWTRLADSFARSATLH